MYDTGKLFCILLLFEHFVEMQYCVQYPEEQYSYSVYKNAVFMLISQYVFSCGLTGFTVFLVPDEFLSIILRTYYQFYNHSHGTWMRFSYVIMPHPVLFFCVT